MTSILVGLTGKAGSGKDTAADYLVREHGFVKMSFADPMKALLNERFGWTMEMWKDRFWKEWPNRDCGFRGGDMNAEPFSPRSWAQWLGTEVGRYIDDDAWVRLLFREVGKARCADPEARIVISDVRFDNEAQGVRDAGGKVIEILRDNLPPVAAHSSEAGISDELVQIKILNLGTVEELHQMIAGMAFRT